MKRPNIKRARVNGAFLSQYHGQQVCFLGTVVKADAGGSAFQVKASDGAQVTIRMRQPLSTPLEGLIEIYGTGQGKNLIIADSYTTFPEQISSTFQMGLYNETIELVHSTEDKSLNPWFVPIS